MRNRKQLTLAVIAVVALAGGCAAPGSKTPRQQVAADWNRTRATVLKKLATEQYAAGHLERCAATIDQAARLDPTDAELHLLAARVAIESGKLDVAETSLTRAAELAPASAEVDYLRGIAHQRAGRAVEALACYSTADEKNPADPAYALAAAEMHAALGQDARAEAVLIRVQERFPNVAAGFDALAQLREAGGAIDEAIALYRRAALLDESDTQLRERLALLELRAGRWGDAAVDLRRLTTSKEGAGRADLWAALGEAQLGLGQPAEARGAFAESAKLRPDLAAAHVGLAKCALVTNDAPRAVFAARRAAALMPDDADARLLLALALDRAGKRAEATAEVRRAALAGADRAAVAELSASLADAPLLADVPMN